MKDVQLYTDGSCLGNPGPGGWAAILVYGKRERELVGADPSTTNNRMELLAAVEGLKALKEPCQVTLYSDSQYMIKAFTERWIDKWERTGWVTSNKEPVKNVDLWQSLRALTDKHQVKFIHVYGHSGHDYNERCDKLARNAALALQEKTKV
ncbi:MAG TPA: ribonuclease HI [Candidatus Xenobia bacterium]|jgi:ribonuclease HI